MPLFGRREPEVEPEPVVEEPKRGLFSHNRTSEAESVGREEPRRHGLFGHNRSPSPVSTVRSSTTTHTANTSPSTISRSSTHRRSLLNKLGRHDEVDPSIIAARERVMAAESAEVEADRALLAAREQVREARAHCKRVEAEAAEEARRAKIKMGHAREIATRGKALGRHGL